MLILIWVAVLKPGGSGCRVLHPDEAAMVRGGSSSSGASSSQAVNIPLNNVPYVTQHLNPKYSNSQQVSRSKKYCGIASALMVRAKYPKNSSSAPALFDGWENYNYLNVDTEMKRIDDKLLSGYYGYYYNNRKIDVLTNKGLLYINQDLNDTQQFDVTTNIVRGVYTGTSGDDPLSSSIRKNSDAVSVDNGHVTNVSIWTANAVDVTNSIWNHIKNNRQPAVVVVDSNKQDYDKVLASTKEPILHYIVIRGIYESSSGGTRNFLIYDPSAYYANLSYSEDNLRKLIAMPYNTPAWVYNYGNPITGSNPAYGLTVQGD
jgi:hypothetical protein